MTATRPKFLGKTAIAGVGFSELSRNSNRTVMSLAVEAAKAAIDDAGLEPADVDGIINHSWENDSVQCQALATALALPECTYILDTAMGGIAPCQLVSTAAAIVDAGLARNVIVFRALNGRSGPRVGHRRVVSPAASYRLPLGLTAYPQVIALWARRFMIETGATPEDLASVAITQRQNAASNERAIQRKPLTVDEYFQQPIIADPFRPADCTAEVDGACALLVTSATAARSMRQRPVTIESAAYVAGPRSGLDPADSTLWPDLSRNYTSILRDRLWGWAGLSPDEVDCAQLYDCFTSTVLLAVEGLGLAERGGAGDFVRSGTVPFNTNGGLLSEGYLHGMNTVAEAVLQLQGRSPGRQVPDARTCVVTSGAMVDGSALVLAAA